MITSTITTNKHDKNISHSCLVITNKIFNSMSENNQDILKSATQLLAQQQLAYQEVVKQKESLERVVRQIAHDLQSPVSSMQMLLKSMHDIPEQNRVLLKNSARDIADLANQLLSKQCGKVNDDNVAERQILLVSTVLSEVVSDRRCQYKNKPIAFDFKLTELNAFTFIKVHPIMFRRAINNLINNAVDALPVTGGKIVLQLSANEEWININILDDGVGIPDNVLQKIKAKESITHGKKNGHGIGMGQVRDMVETNHGEFSIISSTHEKSHGTTITLKFPKVLNPSWICEEINLQCDDTILILDDDSSIHKVWNLRLSHILEKLPNITVKYFTNAQQILDFVNNLPEANRAKLCLLCDYELNDQKLNGLQVISQCMIKRSVLITSHYADLEIRKIALQEVVVKILPKELSGIVPIKIVRFRVEGELVKVHMVFVDDESNFTKNLVANYYSHLIVDKYSNPLEFLDEVEKYAKDTKFVLDNYYYMEDGAPYKVDGIMVAKQLYDKGYTNLFLLSGESFAVPSYLQLILKSDHESLSKLHLL